MVFTAPAKINLYLKIIQKRDDGYHDIETLFERISLFDYIKVDHSDKETSLSCNDPSIPTGPKSLLGKTIQLFREKSQKDDNFHIMVEKNIPVGGGLGGGSSDAATLLKALNEMTGLPLTKKDLYEIACQIGADVPFFLHDTSFAIGKGRGDELSKVKMPVKLWHILITPPFSIYTKEVYENISDFGLTKDNGVDRMFSAFLRIKEMRDIVENLRNDLQRIVLRDFPQLEKVFSELKSQGAKGTLLSGSGSTVFGIFDEKDVEAAASELKKQFSPEDAWQVRVAQTY